MKDLGKVALCLNGAGAKGICQSGSLQAFLDLGFRYDMLYGSSAGSLNGVLLHQGDAAGIKDLWMNISNSQVYKWTPLNIWGAMHSESCIYDNSPLRQLISSKVNLDKLLANPLPFYIAATNYTNWLPYVPAATEIPAFEVIDQLVASAACPIYFPFVDQGGYRLADAGILSNFCIKSALDNGADTIVIIGFANAEPTVPTNVIESAGETISVGIYGQFMNECSMVELVNTFVPHLPAELGYRHINLVKIVPPQPVGLGLLDFDMKGKNREQLWQSGYDLAHTILTEFLSE